MEAKKEEKKDEINTKKITGRDTFVQAAIIAANLNPKIAETNEFNEFLEELSKQGSDEIKYPQILFNHMPLMESIVHEIIKNEDKLVNTKDKNAKIEELTDTLKRLQAEFENYKKWNTKEKSEFLKYAHADLISHLLPVLDSFEMALKNTNDKEKFIVGIKMIYAQFHSILEAEGLRPIKAAGEKFDPYKHEVLMKEESNRSEDTILEEFQKGYMLNDKVLRHSKVKVSGK